MQSLRESFGAVFGEDFEILGDSMKVVENGRCWVVAVRPQRGGTFYFRHQFEQQASYRHHDDESRIVVLEKGGQRRLRYDLNPQSICVGDTLLAPFAMNEGTSAHRFSNVSRFPQYFDGPFESKVDPGPMGGHSMHRCGISGVRICMSSTVCRHEPSWRFMRILKRLWKGSAT